MEALKAQFSVRAGVIPGEAMPELTKGWPYLSSDYAEDGRIYQEWLAKPEAERGPMPGSRFLEMRDAAIEEYKRLTDPARVNWVQMGFMWL
jgi:hypothetical protein